MSDTNVAHQGDFESCANPSGPVNDAAQVQDAASCTHKQAIGDNLLELEAEHEREPEQGSEPEQGPEHEQDHEPEQGQSRIQAEHDIKHKMYIFIREICLLLFLVFTYATFQNTMPKSSRSPNAYPFFPVGSIVKDWYHGQLSDAIELASESDLAFIMYYAPWDAESQSVRREFSIAAQQLHSEVHFAAINCWNPNSECRQQYSKVYSWPVLMAYPAHGRGIQYRGPRKAEYMLRFLHSVAHPFIRINSMADVPEYQVIFGAAVVAQVNARLGGNDYGVFYYTALQFLERDPFRDIVFLVCTHSQQQSLLWLNLWNSSVIYTNEWHPDKMISWLSDSLHQVSTWVSPTGGKSESLSSYLQPGPALILFTPKNPLHPTVDYYSVLHDVALSYYTCNSDFKSNIELKRVYNRMLRKEYNLEYKSLKTRCLRRKSRKTVQTPTIVTYDAKKIWLNSSFECAKHNLRQTVGDGTCAKHNFCNRNIGLPQDDGLKFEDAADWRCPRNLKHLQEVKRCRYFRMAQELQPAIFAPFNFSSDAHRDDILGLACKSNSSLSFLALDSLQYYYFAEGLGIDILNVKDKSAVVIINPALETHHVMKHPFNTTNLEHFISEFSTGHLKRTLSSSVASRQFTHHYVDQEFCERNSSHVFCVAELNTQNFLSTVMTRNLAVVVMYYSTKCAFCTGVSHTLLTVAKILEPVKDLHFARIDGDNHALPWEYSMHHYPNILYFPSRRKSESRIFPQNVPITVTNLLSFILANVEYHIKINAMWAVCNQTLFDEDFDNCIRSIKSECIVQIGQILKNYRLTYNNQQRRELLKHLQHLRSLHFQLENPLRREAIEKHVKVLRFIEKVPIKMETRL